MIEKSVLTAEYVRSILSYDEETGLFTWKVNRRKVRCAGKRAGSYSKGYIKISIHERGHFAHRLAWLVMTGSFPEGDIDHIDGNRSNNRWANLREASASQNLMNMHTSNRSVIGLRGLSFRTNKSGTECIRAVVEVGSSRFEKRFHIKKLGIMVATRDAAIWATATREELHGEFANHWVRSKLAQFEVV